MRQDYTIQEFTNSRFKNIWIRPCEHVFAYVRKGNHLHPNTKIPIKCFDIANVRVEDEYQHQGIFTRWLEQVLHECRQLGYDAVHVENVLSDQFAHFFERQPGWIKTSHLTPSFFYVYKDITNV